MPITSEVTRSEWLTVVGPQGPASPLKVHLSKTEAALWVGERQFLLDPALAQDLGECLLQWSADRTSGR